MLHQMSFSSTSEYFDYRGFARDGMNETLKVWLVHKGFKALVVYLFSCAREAPEATGEEVMFRDHVWS